MTGLAGGCLEGHAFSCHPSVCLVATKQMGNEEPVHFGHCRWWAVGPETVQETQKSKLIAFEVKSLLAFLICQIQTLSDVSPEHPPLPTKSVSGHANRRGWVARSEVPATAPQPRSTGR